MWPGSTGPIHSWKRIGEILLLWSGNCIVTSTFSRKMHLNWKFCIISCTEHFMWLFHFQLGCIHFGTYICVFTAKEENVLDFDGNCCAEDHSMIAWRLNVAVPKSVYCIILEKISNLIFYRPNKEICLFLRNLNLNKCAIWFPV
jgi:hypothetical protein